MVSGSHVDYEQTELLTDFTVDSCKPSVPAGHMVIGVDGGSSGTALILQKIIQTLVHLIVVPDVAMTFCFVTDLILQMNTRKNNTFSGTKLSLYVKR